MSITKPDVVFDRDLEWKSLAGFAASKHTGARLAIVYGRRRQGKTMLLEGLRDQTGGFYWQARQQSSTQNLESLSAALTGFLGGQPHPVRLASWEEAARTLASLGVDRGRPLPVLIDEVGYLVSANPGFPSHLQAAFTPLGPARRTGGARLVLCGSAFGQMRRLVAADAPLRGRADVELVIRPFDYRTAAAYWGVSSNPDVAFRLHALVGGTPAYKEFAAGDVPDDGDIDSWAAQHLLDESSPLFREGRLVVAEDPMLADQTLHWAVLGAVADGASRRGEITAAMGRPPTSLHHALTTLVDAGWVIGEPDPLRAKGARFLLDEPIVRTYRLVTEPNEARLALRRNGRAVWDDMQPTVRARVYGPHLERLTRVWVTGFASEDTLDARVLAVGPSTVRVDGTEHQIDVVATETTPRGGTRVAVVGEVKATQVPVGGDELDRLDRIVDALGGKASAARRLLVARAGFTAGLRRAAARRGDVVLVDLPRLYHGD